MFHKKHRSIKKNKQTVKQRKHLFVCLLDYVNGMISAEALEISLLDFLRMILGCFLSHQ